ncbi:MAG: DUF4124 domain-containing protein [Cellvibrionaceae bacterium]
MQRHRNSPACTIAERQLSKRQWCSLALILLLQAPLSSAEKIYQWTDEKGKVHYGDKRNSPEAAETVKVDDPNTADTFDSIEALKKTSAESGPKTIPISSEKDDKPFKLPPNPKCFSLSAGHQHQGDRYFDIAPISLNTQQKYQLTSLGPLLEGQWWGDSREFACQGSDQAPKIKHYRSKLDATIDTVERSALKIRLTREANEHQAWSGDLIYALDYDNLIALELHPRWIRAGEKHRKKTVNASALYETQSLLLFKPHKITLDTLYYVNGIFVGRETLYLSR